MLENMSTSGYPVQYIKYPRIVIELVKSLFQGREAHRIESPYTHSWPHYYTYLSDVAKVLSMYYNHALNRTFYAHDFSPRFQRYDRLQPLLNAFSLIQLKVKHLNANPSNSPLSSSHTCA